MNRLVFTFDFLGKIKIDPLILIHKCPLELDINDDENTKRKSLVLNVTFFREKIKLPAYWKYFVSLIISGLLESYQVLP